MNRKLKTFALIGAAAALALSGYAATSSIGAESFSSLFADSSDSGNKDASTDGYYIASDNVLHITTDDGWNAVAAIYATTAAEEFTDVTSISLDADISFSQGNISFPLVLSLNGNGYTVSKNTSPLFTQIEEGATLSNLAIDNGTKTYTSINVGYTNFGVLSEANFGTVDNCSVIGTAEIPLQTLIGAAAETTSFYVGGLVGFNTGTISNTYSNVKLILSSSSSDYNAKVVPQALYISDFVGGNLSGTITNCFVDFATPNGRNMSAGVIIESQYESSIYLSVDESATVSDNIPVEIALSIAKNDVSSGGSVSNVYCPKGFFTTDSGEKAEMQYENFIPQIVIQQGTTTVSDFTLSMVDSDYLTMMSDYFPSVSQIPFSNASDWTLTHTWYEKDTAICNSNSIDYRAPMPLMGRSLNLGGLEVAADGSVSVTSRSQWNHLSDAIELGGAKTISLDATIEADNDPTFPVRNFNDGCSLNGNGNTIYVGTYNSNAPTAPFDVIGKGATVSNLGVVYSKSITNTDYSTFGLLARVNSGTISSCYVSGVVENTFYKMLGSYSSYSNGVEVSLGGVVGVNEGTIKELYANVQNVVESTSRLSVCPSALNVGGIAGSNTGEITDVMLDNVVLQNDATVLSSFPVTMEDFSLSFSDLSSAQTVEFNAGQAVGKNSGTISNVHCAKGFYTEENASSSTYDMAISAKSFITQLNSSSEVLSETYVTIFDDKSSMTELSRLWPVSADLSKLFTTPANWSFDRSSAVKSTTVTRRSPVPKMGKESSEDVYVVTIEDGIAIVPNQYTWSQLVPAIADGLDGLTGIEITGDFSLESNETLDVLDVPLYGNAHTLYSATSSLVDSISKSGAIYNLAIVSGNLSVSQPQFGGLARVNCGSIDGVHFSATLSLNPAGIVTAPNVAIGGLVAQNDGYITSTNVTTVVSDASTDTATVSFSGELHSFYVSNAVAVNNATLSDVYVGDADNSRKDEIMSFPTERKIRFSAVDESASFEALFSPVAARNNGSLSHIVAPNGMTDKVKGWSLPILFYRGSEEYSPEIIILIDSETTNDETVTSADSYVTEWATDESLILFQDPSRWTFNTPAERETASNFSARFPVPNMMSRRVSIKVDEETKKISAVASDSSSFIGLFDLLGDSKTHFFQSADVDIPQNIVYNELAEIDGSLTDATIGTVLEKLPTVSNYVGVMNGATIENIAIQSDGIFNNISEDSQVNDLVFNNAIFYVDPTDPVHRRDATEPAIYISLVAKTNMGEVNNTAFFGSVIMDEDKYAAIGDTAIYFSLVGEHDGEALTGFVYLDECAILTTDKRLIAFKQNLCTGEYKRKTNVKVAVRNNNDSGNKVLPLVDLSDSRFNEYELPFSDEEFESGLVACWLNYAGPGFTGIYTGKWSQGKRVPVSCSDKSKALYPVKVQVEGEDCISSIPQFANGGSEITVKYTQRPLRMTLDDTPITIGDDKSTTLTYEGNKTLKVYFESTSIDEVDASDEFNVAVNGTTITFSGVDGKVKEAFDLAGRLVSETNAESMTLNSGVYVVRCGAKSVRVVIK